MPWFQRKKKTGTINGGRVVLAELTHTWGRGKTRERNVHHQRLKGTGEGARAQVTLLSLQVSTGGGAGDCLTV